MSRAPARSQHRRAQKSARQRHDLIAIRERAALIAALMALPYLDPAESAVIAKTHPSTIRRACNDGALAHTRVSGGKLIRISPDDLRAWLSSARPTAA